MESDDRVDEAFSDVGLPPLFAYESQSNGVLRDACSSVVEGILVRADAFREDESPLRPFPDLVAGIIDDPSGNACAFKHDGRYVIGVTWGAVATLHASFGRLLCDPKILPWVGDPAREDPGRLSPEFPRDTAALVGRLALERPADATRREAAAWLADVAAEFLILHEFRHVQAGHVDYQLPVNRFGLISELNAAGPGAGASMVRQAFEMVADAFGVTRVLTDCFELRSPDRQLPDFLAGADVNTLCALAAACVDAVVKLFVGAAPAASPWEGLTHPPHAVRRVMLAATILECLRVWGFRSELDGDWSEQGLELSERAMNALFDEKARLELWEEAVSERGRSHFRKIKEAWQGVAPRLQQDSYVPLPGAGS